MSAITIYKQKQEFLDKEFKQITPLEFYSTVFPDCDIERKGHPEDRKANPIFGYTVTVSDDNKDSGDEEKTRTFMKTEIMFQDRDVLKKTYKNEFAICSMCTYSGRKKTAQNAYKCYGFCIDLDGVELLQLENFVNGVYADFFPCPTYIANSGHGLHLYYIFTVPVSLYPVVIGRLQMLKYGLIRKIWMNSTSTIKNNPSEDNRQYQGIYQGYRCPGSCTKLGSGNNKKKYLVTIYKWGDTYTLWDLNQWVFDEYKIPDDPDYASWEYQDEHVTLDEAKEKWPKWYQKRIIEKKPAGQYFCSPKLYEWWLKKIQEGDNAYDGNRYWCVSFLFVFAIKCGIPLEKVEADAIALVPWLNSLTEFDKEHEPFTKEDVIAAKKWYDTKNARVTKKFIQFMTKITLPDPKLHRYSRYKRAEINRLLRTHATYENNGRPLNSTDKEKEKQIKKWMEEHPDGKQIDCIRDTGISRKTVAKWIKPASPAEVVKTWRAENPNGTKSACIKETKLAKNTVYKYWEE